MSMNPTFQISMVLYRNSDDENQKKEISNIVYQVT